MIGLAARANRHERDCTPEVLNLLFFFGVFQASPSVQHDYTHRPEQR